MSFIVLARPIGEYDGEPSHRYFGPYSSLHRAERCEEGLEFLGYVGDIIPLENFDVAWRATTWNEAKGVRE